jgi:hypothetical protein
VKEFLWISKNCFRVSCSVSGRLAREERALADTEPTTTIIITEAELDALDAPRAEQLELRLSTRWKAMSQLTQEIRSLKRWNDARGRLAAFVADWDAHVVQYKTTRNSGDMLGCAAALRRGSEILNEADTVLAPYLLDYDPPIGPEGSADYVARRVFEELARRQEQFERRSMDALDAIMALKRELVVSKAFGAHVKELGRSAEVWRAVYVLLLVMILAGITAVEIGFRTLFSDVTGWNELAIRFLVATPIAFLVYFLFHQHKVSQLTALKYRHLEGFLNGGSTELAGLLAGADHDKKDLTATFHKQVAEAFLRVDDVTSAIHRAETPLGEALRIAREVDKVVRKKE